MVYGSIAVAIARDGEREDPRYATVDSAAKLLKGRTHETFVGSLLPSVKARYPGLAAFATEKFVAVFGQRPTDDPDGGVLTPAKRKAFVNLLQSLSEGCLSFSRR